MSSSRELQLPRDFATATIFPPRLAKGLAKEWAKLPCVISTRGCRRGEITQRPSLGLSVGTPPGPGQGAGGAGGAMAAVFDLDLETEEGSEGEGEPEFSPAVSVSRRARLDPGVQPVNQRHGTPYCDCPILPRSSPSPLTQSSLSALGRSSLPFPHSCLPFLVLSPGSSSSPWIGRCSCIPMALTPRFLTGGVSRWRVEGCWPGVSEGLSEGRGLGVGDGTWGTPEPCSH